MILPILLNKTRLLPIYVVGIGGHDYQRDISRPEGFGNYQILYCTGGAGVLEIEGKSYEIKRGDAFFFRPGIPHSYHATEGVWQTKWVVFAGSAVEDILEYLGFGKSEVFTLPRLEDFEIQVQGLWELFECDDPEKEVKTSLLMYKLLIQVGEYKNHTVRLGGMTPHEKYEKLHPVLAMMQERYREDLSLTDMAEVIGVTTNHLCRLFQQVYDTTPLKYLTHLRLSVAKEYLSSPKNNKIKDVAALVGFKDPSYFCAVFKKAEGVTPETFRKMNVL